MPAEGNSSFVSNNAPSHQKVKTDKAVYTNGETIIVTGSVSPGFYTSNMMRLDLYKAHKWISEAFVRTDEQGRYQAELTIPTDTEPGSDYQIHVYHAPDGKQWDASELFEIK